MQSQGLQLNQSLKQEQILAPAQLQSLEYLVVPVMELQNKISEELATNPVLEQDSVDDIKKIASVDNDTSYSSPDTQQGKVEAEYTADESYQNYAEMAERWNDYMPAMSTNSNPSSDEEKHNYFFNSIIAPPSIEKQLLEQLSFCDLTDDFKEACKLIVGSINEVGYFQGNLKDLAVLCGASEQELQKALELVQTFDPPGIGAENLKECLYLQLKRIGKADSLESEIVQHHLDEIAANHLPQVAKKLKISIDELKQAIENIRKLKPYPWIASTEAANAKIITPEIAIEKIDGDYTVILKNEYIPRIRISEKYINMLTDPNVIKETKEYIKGKILKGNLIIKNIQQRQETVKKIAEIIIDSQYDFLENGVEYLRPLTMKEVADKIGVHETTVSRAVANKYVETPQGVFEMKYFFTTGYQAESGEVISNRSVMEKIKDIVEDENKLKPLSDEAISKLLKESGLNVARRTVTKYREEQGIPSSRQRKEFV